MDSLACWVGVRPCWIFCDNYYKLSMGKSRGDLNLDFRILLSTSNGGSVGGGGVIGDMPIFKKKRKITRGKYKFVLLKISSWWFEEFFFVRRYNFLNVSSPGPFRSCQNRKSWLQNKYWKLDIRSSSQIAVYKIVHKLCYRITTTAAK